MALRKVRDALSESVKMALPAPHTIRKVDVVKPSGDRAPIVLSIALCISVAEGERAGIESCPGLTLT